MMVQATEQWTEKWLWNGWRWRCAVDAVRPRTREDARRKKRGREELKEGEEGFKLVQNLNDGDQTQIQLKQAQRASIAPTIGGRGQGNMDGKSM